MRTLFLKSLAVLVVLLTSGATFGLARCLYVIAQGAGPDALSQGLAWGAYFLSAGLAVAAVLLAWLGCAAAAVVAGED